MKRKRREDNDCPDGSDEYYPSLEFVAETPDLDYEEEKSEDVDVEAVTEAPAQMFPCSQRPMISSTYHLKEITKNIHSSVVCKLNRVCRHPWLVEEIKKVCVDMKQVQLEGWHLANLHVLRCLKEGDDVPELEQMFFYRCCAATLSDVEKRDRPKKKTGYETFHKTCQLYWSGREREPSYEPEFINYASTMINEMAKLMQINALNMVALHFRRRLHQYIRFKYAGEGKLQLKYNETKRLVDSCFRVKSVPEKDDSGNLTGNTIKDWTSWDDTKNPIEKELRPWLEVVPWQWQIRANSAHFIRKLSDMLAYMEKFVNKHPDTKGARVYSLLPVSTSYQAAYVKLNASTLYGILSRRILDPKVKGFLDTELNHIPFDRNTFQKNRNEVLRLIFDVEQFETRNRTFAFEVNTNGYGASVTMIRPVTTSSVVVVEKQVATKKRKKNDETADTKKKPTKKKLKAPKELAEADTFAKELFKLGPEYSPKVLIGIDPGMRSLVTAVSTGHLPRRRRQKSRRGKHRHHQNRRGKRKERVVQISTREYRHLARFNDFAFYNENLKRREPWYASVIRAMPSFKTASYDVYFGHLQFLWKHLRFLLAFSAEQSFLRWRFTRDRAKMKAMDTLAKRIVPKADKHVCIAYGDWSRRDGLKGHATGPVKGFVKALKRRATVIPMDEYRTSITCSCCHKRLRQSRLFNNLNRKKDEADVRLKEHPSLKEAKEIAEMAKFQNPKLANKKIVLKCTRNVLRCTNSRCKANFWNRDVNAARNMLELLRSGLKGKHGARRLRAFRRGL
ncbi:hypothetical protein DVH05_015221 [Phytophthora capsici]|nr:hypothetical protein DVH05_015221 [Phytophthora capsici]